MNTEIIKPLSSGQTVAWENGKLSGNHVSESIKQLKELKNLFADEESRGLLDPDTIIYKVQVHTPVAAGQEGGLFFGTTFIMPGKIGNEYFMTQGHFHKMSNRAEYYWGIQGKGLLILMNRDRKCRVEEMYPGSLHYIPAETGHRVVNYHNKELAFGACWSSDAGYDYEEIRNHGFSVRVMEVDGDPVIVAV